MVDAAPAPVTAAGNAKSVQGKFKRAAATEPHAEGFSRELTRRSGTTTEDKESKGNTVIGTASDHAEKTEKTAESSEVLPVAQNSTLEDILARFLEMHAAFQQPAVRSGQNQETNHSGEAGGPADRRTKNSTGKLPAFTTSGTLPVTGPGEGRQSPVAGRDSILDQVAADPSGEVERTPVTIEKLEQEHSAETVMPQLDTESSATAVVVDHGPGPTVTSFQALISQNVPQPPAVQILEHLRMPAQALARDTPAVKTGIKQIQFELRPEALGTVQVTLKLSGRKLEIEIAPRERETESLLRSDAALVDQVVRAVTASGDVSSVTVNIAHREPDPGSSSSSWSGERGSGSQQAGEGAGTGHGNPSPRKDEGSFHSHDQSESAQDSTAPRTSVLRPRVV